ncbi:MAG: hypothetical protein ACXIUM_08680 [Wenzhouxiangella sp.]
MSTMCKGLSLMQQLSGISALAFLLAACGGDTTASADPSPGGSTAPSTIAGAAGASQGILVQFAPGGRVDAFCIPEWSINNQTGVDIPGLLIQLDWGTRDGEILQAAGEFGLLQENLKAGLSVDKTMVGHAIACDQLSIQIGRYACRDENAVRMPCPGPLRVLTEGGISADLSGLQEGAMRGAVEP